MRILGLSLALAILAAGISAQGTEGRPRNNSSYVRDDQETLRGLMAQAREAAAAGDARLAADRLQGLLLSEEDGVLPAKGRELFVSPGRWAQLALLGERAPFGREVLDAWRANHDKEAASAIRGALVSSDEAALLALLRRYPAATAAPAALLALTDRALQRGDPDSAWGHLLRLPEHVARSEEQTWTASDAYLRRRSHLESRAVRRPAHWPTIGGDGTRARNGDPLAQPASLALRWESFVLDEVPLTFDQDLDDHTRVHSPVLPFYPVCDEDRVYVHLGARVAVLDRGSGKLLYFAPDGEAPDLDEVEVMLASSPGVRAATVDGGRLYFNRVLYDAGWNIRPRNVLVAFDVESRSLVWTVSRRRGDRGILGRPVFFRGAPAVLGKRLFVYGALREESDGEPTRKEEAHLFCFEKKSGKLLWNRFLGYGDTEAAPDLPPQSGLAPAVAGGVVVAVTGLGVASALDARTGEVLWLFRYDRRPARERERLLESREKRVHLRSGWLREPPRIVGDTVFLAPFDSEEMYACWLRGRRDPRTGIYDLVQWNKGRTKHLNSLLEYVAGMVRSRVYYVGRRDEHHAPEAYQTVVSNPFSNEYELAYGRIPPTERIEGTTAGVAPELFGRPAIAGDVLLVPTKFALFRFDVGKDPARDLREGEHFREIPLLVPYLPPPRQVPEGARRRPVFGNLVALDGLLYAVTADRVLCYGPREEN